MTISEAKKDLKKILAIHEIGYIRITGKTVNFIDWARDSRIFLTVHGVDWPRYTREGTPIVCNADVVQAGRAKPTPYSIHWRASY